MYTSTRKDINVSFSKAVCDGLSSDGGLYFVNSIPLINFSKKFLDYSYKEIAFKVFRLFFEDFTDEEIYEVINKAYSNENFSSFVCKVDYFDNFGFLDLHEGPTYAFKDIALTILPLIMEKALCKESENKKIVILTATSGDTGSAALSGFSRSNIPTIVLYPNNGVSSFQEKQMHKFSNNGSIAVAVEGNFDDCQRLVKKAFSEIKSSSVKLSSANSINIARLLPQIVYYFYAYVDAVNRKKIKFNDLINITVPTGNFGNILASYIAYKMGLPVNKLICASNSNNVLSDFFKTGEYNRNRNFIKTISPSMDILISSNLERLLYITLDNNFNRVSEIMDSLNTIGKYTLSKEELSKFDMFYADYLNEEETKDNINEVYERYHYLIDPHTSCGYGVYKKYRNYTNDNHFNIICSTASPFKFSESLKELFICKRVNEEKILDEFDLINLLAKETKVKVPESINELKNISLNKIILKQEEVLPYIRKIIGLKND